MGAGCCYEEVLRPAANVVNTSAAAPISGQECNRADHNKSSCRFNIWTAVENIKARWFWRSWMPPEKKREGKWNGTLECFYFGMQPGFLSLHTILQFTEHLLLVHTPPQRSAPARWCKPLCEIASAPIPCCAPFTMKRVGGNQGQLMPLAAGEDTPRSAVERCHGEARLHFLLRPDEHVPVCSPVVWGYGTNGGAHRWPGSPHTRPSAGSQV